MIHRILMIFIFCFSIFCNQVFAVNAITHVALSDSANGGAIRSETTKVADSTIAVADSIDCNAVTVNRHVKAVAIEADTIYISGDLISDFAGDGLTVSGSNVLDADLGTAITSDEITDQTIVRADIDSSGGITVLHLHRYNSNADDSSYLTKKYCDDNYTGAGVTYNNIGDPTGDGSIPFGSHTGTYTSGTSAWDGLIISNTVAEMAAEGQLLTLKVTDAADIHHRYLVAVDGSDTVAILGHDGIYLGTAAQVDSALVTKGYGDANWSGGAAIKWRDSSYVYLDTANILGGNTEIKAWLDTTAVRVPIADSTHGGATNATTSKTADSTNGGAIRSETSKEADSTDGGATRATTCKTADSTDGGAITAETCKLADSTIGGAARSESAQGLIAKNINSTDPADQEVLTYYSTGDTLGWTAGGSGMPAADFNDSLESQADFSPNIFHRIDTTTAKIPTATLADSANGGAIRSETTKLADSTTGGAARAESAQGLVGKSVNSTDPADGEVLTYYTTGDTLGWTGAGAGDVTDVVGGAGLVDDGNTGAITVDLQIGSWPLDLNGDSVWLDSTEIVTWALWTEAYDSIDNWNNLINADMMYNDGDTVTGTYVFSSAFRGASAVAESCYVTLETIEDSLALCHRFGDTLSRAFVILDPAAANDFPFWQTKRAITIINVSAVSTAGTNVIGALDEYNATGTSVTAAVDGDWTITTSEYTDASFTNAGIDAGDWLGWHTTSVSGSVTAFSITFEYTEAY